MIPDSKMWILALVVTILWGCRLNTQGEKPNILWITSEDNSPFLGAYGDSLATTPNLDRLAEQGIVYENAFATTPVCAPSRFTLITGLYANVMGTENMRSTFPIPDEIKFFPKYLREAGYHTTNNSKKDYNTVDQPEAWDESGNSATYKTRAPGQPFFHVRNFTTTHESRLHDPIDTLIHDPEQIPIPPYHPETTAIKKDWAHYYDQITKMDAQVGRLLQELEASGEADNTIIFYYSDHGGVVPRSKRFMFESGLRVPLIVYFPPKFAHLAPEEKRTDRLVSFVDFPPTVLSLAGIKPPDYMHGKSFLGTYAEPPRDYVHTYRGRMDERLDLIRAVRDKEYLYVRNFMPHRIYGQHLAYLWKAPSMKSWYEEYLKGNLNATQRRFFQTKPAEELYKVASDPHNIHNLAGDPEYSDVLQRMRKANTDWMLGMKDLGVIPEERINSIRQDQSLYEAVREKNIPTGQIIRTAELASRANVGNLDSLASGLNHPDASVRFWAATGFSTADSKSPKYEDLLLKHTDDPSPAVRIAVAEALYRSGNRTKALEIFEQSLDEPETFTKLRALNAIEALNIKTLPRGFTEKLEILNKEHDVDSGPKKYIYRASESLLERSKVN